MKNLFVLPLAMVSAMAFSQVGINTTTPDPSSILEIQSTNKGLLIPRVALTGINDLTTITNPANGLLVFATANAGTAPNNVVRNNFYKFNADVNQWQLIMDDSVLSKIPKVADLIGFNKTGNDTTWLSADLSGGSNIRQVMFDKVNLGTNYNPSTGEYTASKTGYYSFDINITLVSGTAFQKNLRLGASNPYTGAKPTSMGNGIFSFFSEPFISANSGDGSGVNHPVTLQSKGIIFMTQGQKVVFVTRFIDPAQLTLNIEGLGYNRVVNNFLNVTYYSN
ncbi:hypothetical protein [Chryseobacterium culicis]|uniref:C1q-like domain-containing protein n=1 Tax=Chryseobacterium culicis TaxID=680127 RepID=UPI001874E8AC|nr:hypothetical protein [Chryseobacterium culicis]MBE4948566.1 hypothetical protein [Chryseobacterium culicis]